MSNETEKRQPSTSSLKRVRDTLHERSNLYRDALYQRAKLLLEKSNMLDHLKNKKGQFLDIGSGMGHLSVKIQEAIQGTVTSIDLLDYPLSSTKQRLEDKRIKNSAQDGEQNQTGGTHSFARAQELSFPDQQFDAGVSLAFLLNQAEPEFQLKILNEATRVLGEGAYIHVFEDVLKPGKGLLTKIHQELANPALSGFGHHARTDEGWQKLFQEAGLEVVEGEDPQYFESYKSPLNVNHAYYVLQPKTGQ